ncbi:uncharacterized protein LOC131326348 [Rhododendron vialii]|uniref:uncharacterized protein LOC131326348 n=1 Tax=Rhododendron vialii TaxID=182163 RepID=UPI00265F0145|nr:uncharacterized protein LOC131326348 [Rhododendron vialii]
MNPGSPEDVPASKDVNRPDALKKLYTEPSHCNRHFLEYISIDELGNSLAEFLRVQDGQLLPSKSILCQSSDKTDNPNEEMEQEFEDPGQSESATVTSEKCLFKFATFPSSGKKSPASVPIDGEDDIAAAVSMQSGCETVKPANPRSISLPTHFKLVSALKGSRERQGKSQKKLTVTWAPDVYDPPPSAPTLSRNSKRRPKNERKKYDKKNGKNKQKGKPSRVGGSKDKKQVRKYSESSKSFSQWPNNDNTEFEFNEPCEKLEHFGVGNSDAYCGSSFLKNSITKLHFSMAEAT